MTDAPFATIRLGAGPILAIASHHGHDIRNEARPWMLLGEAERLREEDPFTGDWTGLGDSSIVVHRSRFETDVNRPPELAVYRRPEDAWGLSVWSPETPGEIFTQSLRQYAAFYADLRRALDSIIAVHGVAIVLDLHTYNHRRGGPQAAFDDPDANPEINLGTGTMDRSRWAGVVDRFLTDLRSHDFRRRRLDVCENVRFRGGHLPLWIHATYPESVCALAIEVKKFFMDEWTGVRDESEHADILEALCSTLPGLNEELANAAPRITA
jgi:N-formylglutamate deformylase